MKLNLSTGEREYLNEVLSELKKYQINSRERRNIKNQIIEHIQESRENGEDSLTNLGDISTFISDYLEIQGGNIISSDTNHLQYKGKIKFKLILFISFVCTYFLSQLMFSMFLTQSFNPKRIGTTFDYNILYRIAENTWWNSLLILMSLSISIIITIAIMFYRKNKALVRS
ncbi:hypothetical protein JOC86_000243 [Bacillus pakistanensis]|uniref:Uncharacterized protein n=1 Tax=Rossellomorea pakistanensis TaxID=992288 RepID=A0ABS2N7X3_9BACI|nr:hypothetical protein [Bacillus pakistanensis]MBM7583706.1 hypothetical protein [Bacillus pakistanensis]